jgi:ketosteroid isomerase-like protein
MTMASQATARNLEIARAAYDSYVNKDRAALEAVLASDFHFTSPLDNRLDRETYFRRCWPNSKTIAGFDFINLVPDGNRVFVTYEGRNTTVIDFGTPRSSPFATPRSSMSRCTSAGLSRIGRHKADS